MRLLEPQLTETGDLDVVRASVERLLRDGTGAMRQRAAFEADGMAGVRRLLDASIVADRHRNGEPSAAAL